MKALKTCSQPECDAKHYGKGLCYKHWYAEWSVRPENKQRARQRSITWQANKKEQGTLTAYATAIHRRRKYGLTVDDVQQMLNSQKGACATCSVDLKSVKMCVDHCHTTGKVRGLLCGRCNTALGHVKDSPVILKALIDYLEKHQ